MKAKSVIILTGPVQSGKSTALLKWSEHKNVGGFLSLVVSGRRTIFTFPEKKYFPFQREQATEDTISIGRYHLLKSAFEQMNHQLIEQSNRKFDWLIIDEVGPLELNGDGIYKGLVEVVNKSDTPLLLVVREGLVEQVVSKFNIQDCRFITIDKLANFTD